MKLKLYASEKKKAKMDVHFAFFKYKNVSFFEIFFAWNHSLVIPQLEQNKAHCQQHANGITLYILIFSSHTFSHVSSNHFNATEPANYLEQEEEWVNVKKWRMHFSPP